MTCKFYLDTRKSASPKESAPLCIMVRHKKYSVRLPLDVKVCPENWFPDSDRKIIIPGNKGQTNLLNQVISRAMSSAQSAMWDAIATGRLDSLDEKNLKRYLEASIKGQEFVEEKTVITFESRFIERMKRTDNEHTKTLYDQTLKKLRMYDEKFSSLTFEDINAAWLRGFDAWLAQYQVANSRAILMRNIRTVFNEAIDDEITAAYPFRKFKIKTTQTKDRSLSPENLRTIFAYPCEPWQREYIDIFKLMFLLVGINMGDLANLERIESGRAIYYRMKTHKPYSIKVEPEAMEIINRYRGKKKLLSILDRYATHGDYLKHMNRALKHIGMDYCNGRKYEGEALFPEISTYYARYSWATIAADLDVPRETIAAALGHSIPGVTAIYIRTDMRKKIDAANRKVIDYVLYGITGNPDQSSVSAHMASSSLKSDAPPFGVTFTADSLGRANSRNAL